MKRIRCIPALVAAALGLALAAPAHAEYNLYTSANYVDENTDPFNPLGNYIIDGTNLVGAEFTVTGNDVRASSLGGNFTQYSAGTIFGAIVAVNGGVVGAPSSALAHVVFDSTGGGDETQALAAPVLLNAGTYAVVFGSGLWGATGSSGLVAGQDAIGNPVLVQSTDGTSFSALTGDTVRVTVNAVPEPSTWALLAGGLLGVAALRTRRSR